MFRRLSNTLPKDFVFPADLEQLGYFVNENDQLRMIKKPDERYQYAINRNERVNDVYKEAMNTCIRKIVLGRLHDLGLQTLRLPIGAPADENHVPILVSPDLNKKKRVIVLLTERNQDLGIFSYRTIGDEGINKGSAVEFVSAVLRGDASAPREPVPGIILSNAGQLLWYRGGSRAISRTEWSNLPRESAVHQDMRVDETKNKIPGNRDEQEHVQYILEHVVGGMLAEGTKIDVVGFEWTGLAALRYFAANWSKWSPRVGGLCLLSPQHDVYDLAAGYTGSSSFAEFVSKRCRAYFVSTSPRDMLMTGRGTFGCNCYASGEEFYPECVFIRAWSNILAWFKKIHADPGFEEAEFMVMEAGDGIGDSTDMEFTESSGGHNA